MIITEKNKIAIPDDLKSYNSWLPYLKITRPNGKTGKMPVEFWSGNPLKAWNNPNNWLDFETVYSNLYRFDGLGFVVSEKDPFTFIDLDDCLTPDKKPWSRLVVQKFNSYTEFSPSGKGLRIVCRATIQANRKNDRLGVEIADHNKFFTLTGNRISNHRYNLINPVDFDLLEYFKIDKRIFTGGGEYNKPYNLSDNQLIEKACQADPDFAKLWSGNFWHGSQSSADFCLCIKLAWWTGKDPEQIDRLFRQSGLYRKKWEREDYATATIRRAISSQGGCYGNR